MHCVIIGPSSALHRYKKSRNAVAGNNIQLLHDLIFTMQHYVDYIFLLLLKVKTQIFEKSLLSGFVLELKISCRAYILADAVIGVVGRCC